MSASFLVCLWLGVVGGYLFLAGAAIANLEVPRCREELRASVHGFVWPDRQHQQLSDLLCQSVEELDRDK